MSSRETTSLRQRWTAYQDLQTLIKHWYWRPGWHPGRHFYTWHLTFQHQAALHDHVIDLQQQLALLPGLDLVPLDGLHLTTQGVGFTDEVSDSDLQAMIAEARYRCGRLPPLQLSLGPVDPDAEGIGLLVRPWAAVERVRDAVRASIAAVWPVVPEPADGFRPHITIAYSGAPRTHLTHSRPAGRTAAPTAGDSDDQRGLADRVTPRRFHLPLVDRGDRPLTG
ncbi:2'-5' RNA ligase family protein [Micromonospora sp. NPDC001898]|uniref:2'-5' RNA ligase family protein n=1 Tax=Micromonospora rubida TaxID=2697657 RepID=A0ABW7SVH2_9ACTN